MCDNAPNLPPSKSMPHGSGSTMTGKGQHTQGADTPTKGKPPVRPPFPFQKKG
jgi:hypothetical protein